MCSVGDAFNIDIAEDIGLCEYECKDCGKKFKGVKIAKSLKCPKCHSANTSMIEGK